MKVNKLILRVCHFFGLRKGEEHIDDVSMKISSFKWSRAEIESWNDTWSRKKEVSDYMVDDIKSQVKNEFERNPKFEKRCRNAHQVWITLEKEGGLMKMLYYRDGVLYYQYSKDIAAKERDDKLRDILNEEDN